MKFHHKTIRNMNPATPLLSARVMKSNTSIDEKVLENVSQKKDIQKWIKTSRSAVEDVKHMNIVDLQLME